MAGKTVAAEKMGEMQEMDRLLGLEDVAEILGVSHRRLKYLVQDRELASVKLGGRRLIRRSDLREFMAGLGDE